MGVFLVEPDSDGRISGGYLYNRKLSAASSGVQLVSLSARELASGLAPLPIGAESWLLVDSLLLHPASLEPFLALRRRTGCRLGLLLHAFPSFVARAPTLSAEEAAHLMPTPLELTLVQELDAVVSPGPYAERVLRRSGLRLPCLICPPGAVPVDDAPEPPRSGPPTVLSVCNVTLGKGLKDAVRALGGLSALAWRWEVVGSLHWDRACVAELTDLVAQHGLSSRVQFSGQLSHQATLERYRRGHVFLLPSRSENHPLTLLEAQAFGLPAVAYATGGVVDVVEHEQSGLLAPPFDIAALEGCLGRLIADASERARLGQGARLAALGRPDWRASAERLQRELQNLHRVA